MKTLLLALILTLGSLTAFGQAPDCQFTQTFTATGYGVTTLYRAVSNTGTQCTTWRLSYYTAGITGVAIQVEGAPDASGTVGTFAAVPNNLCSASVQPPCLIDGSNPLTNVSNDTMAFRGYYGWVAIHVTTFTGTGKVTARMYGYKGSSPSAASRSSGGSGTFTALTGDATSTATGGATTVLRINGTTVPVNTAADQVLGTTAAATASWMPIANCVAAGGVLQYATATHAFSCHTLAVADLPAHNLLSTTHGDTTASAAVRGGGIFAVGASPLWTQIAHSGATGGYWKWNGTDVVASTGAAGGTGSCTNQAVTAENADAAPTCTTVTSAYVDTSIAKTGTDINTSNQVTVTHLAAALPVNQGGTGTALTLVGLVRGNASAMTAAELSGDATTSGSNAVSVVKINGGSVPVSANVLGSNASSQPIAATATNLSALNYVAGGGTAQVQTATLSPAVTALTNGLHVCWLPIAANTAAAPTLQVNATAAKPVTKFGATALVANDLITTATACAIYDGSEYQLQNPQTQSTAVLGSGTVNYIPKFTASGTIGNSALIDDGTQIYTTAHTLSIGTSSVTAYSLTLGGASTAFYIQRAGMTNGTLMNTDANGTLHIGYYHDDGSAIVADNLDIYYDGTMIAPHSSLTLGRAAYVSPFSVGYAPNASANYGTFSLGSGYFDGTTPGKFVGSASGTSFAVNEVSGYGGNLFDLQVAGVSKAGITSTGLLTLAASTFVLGGHTCSIVATVLTCP